MMNGIKQTKTKIFYFSLLVIAFLSPAPYCSIKIDNTFVYWVFALAIVLLIPYVKKIYGKENNGNNYIFVKLFLIWTLVGLVRGIFIADNYWEYKNMISGVLCCMMPAFTYVFSPQVLGKFYRLWIKYCIPAFFLFYLWFVTRGEVNFYLAPIFVLGCFLPYMPRKWKIIIGVLLAFMLVADFGARSQVIKSALALFFSLLCVFRKFISNFMLKVAHAACYLSAVILLTLGISGTFNIFTDMSSNEGKYVEKKVVNGEVVEDDVSADTRTFIYVEVLGSAISHNYVVFGRSLARGNDSQAFGSFNAEELKTGKYERYQNELCHLNIFTWLGLIGAILWSLIYFRSSYLAVYHSKSYFLKLIGVFIAFHWMYGWVEDTTNFDIMNITLWSAISMGLSSQFREMSDQDFIIWFKYIFRKNSNRQIVQDR